MEGPLESWSSAALGSPYRKFTSKYKCVLQADFSSPDSWFEVNTGFKQGDVNAPMLFNIFIDIVIRSVEPLLKNLGIKVSYRLDGNLRECSNPTGSTLAWLIMYADDIALISETREQMQQIA